MTCIALLSDIHGNLPALEAVVADIKAAAPDAVYVLGDMVNGCPWPAEVVDMLTTLGWPMLMGNHDDAVLQLGTLRMESRYADKARYATLWWTRAHLNDAHLRQLACLPLQLTVTVTGVPPIALTHGVPGNFFMGIRPDTPAEWAAGQLRPVAEETFACGHTHVAMVRRIGRWTVLNSGAVGAPYDGDPRPSYLLAWGRPAGWEVEIRRVSYDLAAVEEGYRTSGLQAAGGAIGEMFRRSVLSGLPWVSDFAWWMRSQPAAIFADPQEALRRYDAQHGPGHWSFPYASG